MGRSFDGRKKHHGRHMAAHTKGIEVLWCVIPLLVLAAYYCFLAAMIGSSLIDGGPDESARLLVPKAMLMGKLLPSGYDPVTIELWGNYSYAFYPQLLGSYVTAIFELVPHLLGAPKVVQLYAARLSSVCWGLTGVYFTGKAVCLLLGNGPNRHAAAAFAMLLMGFWPQYAFISAYVNNDIIATAGVSVMLFALVRGIRKEWNKTSCTALAAGIVICALGYLNSYGFILAAIIVFVVTCVRQHDRARATRLIGITAFVCALCTFPFFAVNAVRYGDPIGSRVFEDQYRVWVAEHGEELMHPHEGGLKGLLQDDLFFVSTATSFVGKLGYMTVPLVSSAYVYFGGVTVLGLPAFLIGQRTRKALFTYRWRGLAMAVLLAVGITIFLHLWRSATVDYQPQGRYVMPVLVPLVLCASLGIEHFVGLISSGKTLFVVLMVATALISCTSMVGAMCANEWGGLAEISYEYVDRVIP